MTHTTQAIAFSHFPDLQAAVSYVVHELLSTLQDDLQKMEGSNADHYDDANRQEMKNRIADIETIAPLIENLPALHAHLRVDIVDQLTVDQITVGIKILSFHGEMSDTNEAQDVHTGPNAIGEVIDILENQEHCFSVAFSKGVSIFLSKDELMDSSKYRLYHLV